jgi:hypothetical protein
MKEKEELYKKLLKKYGKVLSKIYITFTILENDIENAKKILEDSYKEECEYNEHRKGEDK